MRLTLIAPGFGAASAFSHDPLAGFERCEDAPTSWQAALQAALGLDAAGLASDQVPAANAWHADTGLELPAGKLLRADPVHLQADRDTAILRPAESLGLSAVEADKLVTALNDFLREDGLVIHAADPARWYLCGDALPLRSAAPPDAFAFRSYDPANLSGAASDEAERSLRGLLGELEMLLFSHPVNVHRREHGMPGVSSLYCWGAAVPWQHSVAPDEGPIDLVVGNDAFTRCAAQAAGVACVSPADAGAADAQLAQRLEQGARVVVVDGSLRGPWLTEDAQALQAAHGALLERHAMACEVVRATQQLQIMGEHGLRWLSMPPAAPLGLGRRAVGWARRLLTATRPV